MNSHERRIHQRNPKSGFSLVELLVVIVIVAVLAALSFTITRNLKQRASATKCMQQLREWNIAIHGYAADHNQTVLLERWAMVGSGDTKAYNPYLSASETKSPMPNGAMGIALDYYRRCPAQWKMKPLPKQGYFMGRPNVRQSNGNYGKNGAMVDTNGDEIEDSYSLVRMANPSQYLMMMDSHPSGSTPYRASELKTFVKPICIHDDPQEIRHSGSVHGMFADGHVEILKWGDIDPDNSKNTDKVTRWFNLD